MRVYGVRKTVRNIVKVVRSVRREGTTEGCSCRRGAVA